MASNIQGFVIYMINLSDINREKDKLHPANVFEIIKANLWGISNVWCYKQDNSYVSRCFRPDLYIKSCS